MIDDRQRRPGEGAFNVILLLIGLVLVWQSYKIAGFSALSSPGAFPLAASATMVVAALIVVIGDWRRPSAADNEALSGKPASFAEITPTVVVVFVGFVIGYSALLDILGFLPTSFLFLFLSIQFLHRGSVVFSFFVALGSLIVIYVIFRLIFTVVLPEGIVPEREIMAWFGRLFASGEPQ